MARKKGKEDFSTETNDASESVEFSQDDQFTKNMDEDLLLKEYEKKCKENNIDEMLWRNQCEVEECRVAGYFVNSKCIVPFTPKEMTVQDDIDFIFKSL